MIDISYCPSLCSVRILGHAGSAPKGEDLVCAAVTALAQTLAANVQELAAHGVLADKQVYLMPGLAEIRCTPRQEFRSVAVLVFDVVCTGLEKLAQTYPRYLRYQIQGMKDSTENR